MVVRWRLTAIWNIFCPLLSPSAASSRVPLKFFFEAFPLSRKRLFISVSTNRDINYSSLATFLKVVVNQPWMFVNSENGLLVRLILMNFALKSKETSFERNRYLRGTRSRL